MARPKPAIVFIFITLFLDIFGIGVIVPVLPKLVEQLQGGNVQAAAHSVGWLGALYALMQFIFSPVLGSLSDRKADSLSIRLVESTLAAVFPLRGTSTATVVLDGIDRALDLADRRRAAADAKLPSLVVGTLVTYCVVVAGLFGYALTSTASRNRVASYLLFALFASVIAMILDLDRPHGGAIIVGQEPMTAVLQKLPS